MASKEYDWHLGQPPPAIALHSLTKHRVYEEYLLHYIQVLNSNPRIPDFQLTLVDGFAGGGDYLDPRDNSHYEGSPTRLIKAAEVAAVAVNETRRQQGIKLPFKLDMEYYFIEKKTSNFQYLNWYLKEQGLEFRFEKNIFLIQGSFITILPKLVEQIARNSSKRRCIFLLDQYGYKDVPFQQIQRIFSRLPNAEIILTFATDWLIDYMADGPRFMKTLKNIGMDSALDVKNFLEQKEDNPLWRQLVQKQLHQAIHHLSSAKHYTPFFILSKESNRSFWLIHLSNHPRARDVMTQLHWQLKNHFTHYGGAGLRMFGYDPSKDENLTGLEDLFSSSEFSFDEEARKRTLEGIIEEMPRIIYQYTNGISFDDFYKLVANSTPATADHIREAAGLLIGAKELDICGVNGEQRRKSNSIHRHDIIRLPKQAIFSFGNTSLLNLKGKGEL